MLLPIRCLRDRSNRRAFQRRSIPSTVSCLDEARVDLADIAFGAVTLDAAADSAALATPTRARWALFILTSDRTIFRARAQSPWERHENAERGRTFDRRRICERPFGQRIKAVYSIQKQAQSPSNLSERLMDFRPGRFFGVLKRTLKHKFANSIEIGTELRAVR
jgi:hypothetical protein